MSEQDGKRRRRRHRKPRLRVRTLRLPKLPSGIYRWELRVNNHGGWHGFIWRRQNPDPAEDAENIHELLKRSAAGRWKAVRTTRYGRRVITKILLERESDVILVKLCHHEPLYRIFRIEVA